MKKIVTIIVIAVVAGIAVYLYRPKSANNNGKQLTPTLLPTSTVEAIGSPATSLTVSPTTTLATTFTATPTPVTEIIIRYTASGFQPNLITVKVGTKVTFRNESGDPMWPASAVHPTHQLLPEFNAKSSIATGGAYSFTFQKIGTWPFHNHLKPNFTGKVTVE